MSSVAALMEDCVLQSVLRTRDSASKVLHGIEQSTNSLTTVFVNDLKEAGLLAGAAIGGIVAFGTTGANYSGNWSN